MDMKGLMPWSRDRNVPASRYSGDENPLLALHREMNRTFDDFLRGFGLPVAQGGWTGAWPHVEVSETDKDVRVVAELPGLEERDVELTLNGDVLTLKGEKKSENESPTYTERWHGKFQRSIQLGADVDPDKIEASFKNGVLTVTLPKRPESQNKAKRIAIKAG
ncbi:Hsp20/alpha crystallin family protein [Roseomonas chloroacetimidivorans]|uniref:Hsp20/alpha crystallin family protein n=1 Tax=Roseomonas chloroacetimidivorans TaxID=1766656 RepID=UPI003C746186